MNEDLWASDGPVSTLPGSSHDFPEGTCCDQHADRPAVRRIQTETDSFGCEYSLMCAECHADYKAEVAEEKNKEHYCEWCKKMKKGVSDMRDYEEGLSGRVYQVCSECRSNYNKQFEDDCNWTEPVYDEPDWDGEDLDGEDLDGEDWDIPEYVEPKRTVYVNTRTGKIYNHPHLTEKTTMLTVPVSLSQKKLRKLALQAMKG